MNDTNMFEQINLFLFRIKRIPMKGLLILLLLLLLLLLLSRWRMIQMLWIFCIAKNFLLFLAANCVEVDDDDDDDGELVVIEMRVKWYQADGQQQLHHMFKQSSSKV